MACFWDIVGSLTGDAAAAAGGSRPAREHPPSRFATPLACVIVAPLLVMVFAALGFLSVCSDLAAHLNNQAVAAEKLWPKE